MLQPLPVIMQCLAQVGIGLFGYTWTRDDNQIPCAELFLGMTEIVSNNAFDAITIHCGLRRLAGNRHA